jgi:hypothetical protein
MRYGAVIDWEDVTNKPDSIFRLRLGITAVLDVGTRPKLNFIEGTNITITEISDDNY